MNKNIKRKQKKEEEIFLKNGQLFIFATTITLLIPNLIENFE
jgi:hypothetical protein